MTTTNSSIPTLYLSRREALQLIGLGLLAPGALAGCSHDSTTRSRGSSYDATVADARAAIVKALADTATPSASVALTDGQRIIWEETFGYIDQARSIRPGPETMYCIGSASKVIAAVAAMILVDRSLVGLDVPLVRYLPGFRMASPEYGEITVRMLLNHSSGFPGCDYRNIFTFAPLPGYADQVRQTLAGQRLKHRPGETAVYCNDGFTMVELLVAALSGKPYPQFVRDEILTPLGMTRSSFALAPFSAGSYAPAFRADGTPQPQECTNAYAPGGLYTTPGDMARLAMMFINNGEYPGGRILSAAAVAGMARDQTAGLPFYPLPSYKRYGLGWDSVSQPGLFAAGVTCWEKSGATLFYSTDYFVAPRERLALLITGASTTFPASMLAERIMLNALAEQGSIAVVPAPLPALPRPEQAATDADLAAVVGIYGTYESLVRVDQQTDRTLKVSGYTGGAWLETAGGLKRRDDGTFSSNAAPLDAFRTFDGEGNRYLAAAIPDGMAHYQIEIPYAQRIEPAPSLSAAWESRAGRRWLAVNEDAHSVALALGMPPRFTLETITGLPGYLLATGIGPGSQIVAISGNDTVARMFLVIPALQGRDLNDVVIETRDGDEWVRYGSTLFRPEETVPDVAPGTGTVTVGPEGLAQWRRMPIAGTVTIAGASAWKLYDAGLALLATGSGNGTATTPAGALLLLYGEPGREITVTV